MPSLHVLVAAATLQLHGLCEQASTEWNLLALSVLVFPAPNASQACDFSYLDVPDLTTVRKEMALHGDTAIQCLHLSK
jgi:hypothetical protein